MPKHAIRIPARRAGRRVRWMLEVSADVGEGIVRPKTSRKSTRPKRAKRLSRAGISHRRPVTTSATRIPPVAPSSAAVVAPAVSVVPAPTSAGVQTSPRASETAVQGMVAIVVVGALVLGAFALTAYPSRRVVPVARNPQPETLVQPVHVSPAALTEAQPARVATPFVADASTPAPRPTVEKPKPTPVRSPIVWPPASLVSSPPTVAAAAGAGPVRSETVASERTGGAPVVGATTTSDAVSQAVTTMRGCLESTVDGDEFRLTDTEGADAPKARSWRSGFLKKRSAAVELVDLSDPAMLRKYVGRRVVATGVLTGRELRVRSLQAAGSSCN